MTSPEDLAAALRAVSPGLEVELLPGSCEHPGHQDQPFDLARSRQELGYVPRFDLAAGMGELIERVRQRLRSTAYE